MNGFGIKTSSTLDGGLGDLSSELGFHYFLNANTMGGLNNRGPIGGWVGKGELGNNKTANIIFSKLLINFASSFKHISRVPNKG